MDDFWVGQALGGLEMPAIAIVDSGVQTGRLDFSGRLLKQVRLTSLAPNSLGDGRGHGTFVAGIAAGAATKYAGAAPTAPIVSLDVMDDNGMALTSDVVVAADWILQNKATYNIRVANFSLQSSCPATFASGGIAFDAASWANTAQADASWNSASWANASWSNASWAAASWNAASWAAASWAAASWNAASWAAAAWAS